MDRDWHDLKRDRRHPGNVGAGHAGRDLAYSHFFIYRR
jgi:hypothetical protein